MIYKQNRSFGFTLIELMVVMVIIGLMLGVAPSLFSKALPGTQLKGGVRSLAAGLRKARSNAINKNSEFSVKLYLEERYFNISGKEKRYALPNDKIEIQLFIAESESFADDNGGAIRFFPDGSSTGGRITLKYKTKQYEVDVNWLTGQVVIFD